MAAQQAYVSWDLNEDPILDEEGNEVGAEEYVLIEKIYVPAEQRRQGLARKMLREALKEAKEKHAGLTIKIAALPFDGDAIEMDDLVAFCESEGFEVENTDGHAVIMSM